MEERNREANKGKLLRDVVWKNGEVLCEAKDKDCFGEQLTERKLEELTWTTRIWEHFRDLEAPKESDAKKH